VDFDAALRIESRALTQLIMTPQAKNIINTMFFQMNQVNGGANRPAAVEKSAVKKLGVLGAGMMGQGMTYVSAAAGIEVVLKDISLEAAQKGKAYSEKLLSAAVSKGRMSELQKTEILNRITPAATNDALRGCDLIVEAVFENLELKAAITKEAEPLLSKGGVF